MSVASFSTATSDSDGDLDANPEDTSMQVSQEGRNFIKRLLLKDPEHQNDDLNDLFRESIDWKKTRNESIVSLGSIQMDLSQCFWRSEDIDIHNVLGESNFGSVYGKRFSVTHLTSNKHGNMKIVWKMNINSKDGWKDIMNERKTWQKLTSHSTPYILSMLGFFETEATYCFVSEPLDDFTTLTSVLSSAAPLTSEVAKILSGQIALALDCVHRKGFLLRTLNPDTILIRMNNAQVVLGSFDYAKETNSSRRRVGSPFFASPQVVQGTYYGREADWWAFAIILLEMITAATPLSLILRDQYDIKVNEGQSYSNFTFGPSSQQEPLITSNEHTLVSPALCLQAIKSIPAVLSSKFLVTHPVTSLLREILQQEDNNRFGCDMNDFSRLQFHPFYRGLKWKELTKRRSI